MGTHTSRDEAQQDEIAQARFKHACRDAGLSERQEEQFRSYWNATQLNPFPTYHEVEIGIERWKAQLRKRAP